MKPSAIGVVEISYYANSLVVLDAMLKAADVRLAACYKTLGGMMVHLIVAGETAAVSAAIETARQAADAIDPQHLKVAVTISNPHIELCKLLHLA